MRPDKKFKSSSSSSLVEVQNSMLASGSPKESEEMWQDGDICPLGTWTIHHVQFLMSGGNKNHDFQISITTNLKQKYTQKTQMCVFQFAFCMSFLVI